MNIHRHLLACILFIGMASSGVMGDDYCQDCDYYVGKHGKDTNTGLDWDNAFLTIQHAIDQIPHGAPGGDSKKICVASEAGDIYYEDLVCNGKMSGNCGEPGGTFHERVEGVDFTFNPGPTMRGTGTAPVFFTDGIYSGSYNVKIDNFYINNGFGKLEGSETFGGGIYVTAGHNLNLYNCVITDNYAQQGAGILVGPTSTAGIEKCWFARNGVKTPGQNSNGTAILNRNGSSVVVNDCLACGALNDWNPMFPFTGINGSSSFTYEGQHVTSSQTCPRPTNLCASDTDMDGDTDIEDLLNVIEGWGDICSP